MVTPQEVLTDSAQTYEHKNSDYGASWLAIGEILHGLTDGEPITLREPRDFVSFGLFTRRMDKLARAFSGEFLSSKLNFEGLEDSHADAATYAAMHAATFSLDTERVTYENDHGAEPAVDPRYEAKYRELVATGE